MTGMTGRYSRTLREQGVISALLFLHDKDAVPKHDLAHVIHGWRKVDGLVKTLETAGLVKVDSWHFGTKSAYRICLSGTGKRVVGNLLDSKGQETVAVKYTNERHGAMLYLIDRTNAVTLNDLLGAIRVDDAYRVLWELQQLDLVEIERIPGIRISDSRIIVTRHGRVILGRLKKIERILRENSLSFSSPD